ncbi:MAG: DUF1116 domain-containing protein [Alphaproteobacteria bacterium]|nr:DUF1116 domain-containing protein [Alphaproteobacteria bacterium]
MTPQFVHPADQLAYDRAVVTQPVWNGFDTAAEALRLDENVLLHAGPPFRTVDVISRPIMNSACVAAVYEGLARDFETAEAMIRAGEILLKPAQDHNVVTPLAAVVSASMPLHGIYDAHRGEVRVFAPINGGARPAMRLGLRSQAVLDHIRWLNGPFCSILDKGLAEGMALIPLAVIGLANGDDCHGRTIVSTKALIAELEDRTPGGIQDEEALDFMASSPSLFLNLWMAATKCLMILASGVEGSSLVTAAGANGVEAGIQVSGCPGRWFTTPATPPVGQFDVDLPADRALGAIGDSAVVEGFGLGAMAINLSPAQRDGLGTYLPDNSEARLTGLSIGSHPYFRSLDVNLGLTARSVMTLNSGPMIGLGILDRNGEKGRLGGGIYDMPVTPFADAMAELGER